MSIFPVCSVHEEWCATAPLITALQSHPSMQAVLALIKKLYPLRTCKLALTSENIRQGKFNVCLEYHIKNCKAPCTGLQSQDDYMENIAAVREILRGNTQAISSSMLKEMQALASEMRFEEAQKIKEKYELIESYRAKSEVVSSSFHNIDVFSIETDENAAYINYLHITNGCVNQAFTFEYKVQMGESKEELLQLGIAEMRERYKSLSKEIIVPFELDMEMQGVTFTIPQRGEKKHLLELSIMNVKQYKLDRLKQAEKLNPEQRSVRLMKEIQEQLHLPKMPVHIECFDNSNIQGSDAVSCLCCLKKSETQQEGLPEIYHQDRGRTGRLCIYAGGGAPTIYTHPERTGRTARLDSYRWR